jgi:hypothetical protein
MRIIYGRPGYNQDELESQFRLHIAFRLIFFDQVFENIQ